MARITLRFVELSSIFARMQVGEVMANDVVALRKASQTFCLYLVAMPQFPEDSCEP
jgi:hypothetical protein